MVTKAVFALAVSIILEIVTLLADVKIVFCDSFLSTIKIKM